MSLRAVVLSVVGILVVAVGAVWLLIATGDDSIRDALRLEIGKATVQLAVVGVLGVVAKFLLDDYSAAKARSLAKIEQDRIDREKLRTSRVALLNAVTATYWHVRKSFQIIEAHGSARSYGIEMRKILDLKIELQRLDNEIVSGMYGLEESEDIGKSLLRLDQRLTDVLDEWKNRYLSLSRLQLEDEATDDPSQRRVPGEIAALPELSAIRTDEFKAIHAPFEAAVEPIRKQLRAEIEQIEGPKAPAVRAVPEKAE